MRHTASARPHRHGKTQASEIHFDGNPVSVLHLFHHKDAVEIAYAVDVAEFLAHELLIRLHVPCLYLQGEVVFAAGVVAFRYLINVLDGSHEIVHKHLGMVFKAHVAQNGDAVVCLLGIEYGMIAFMKPSRSRRFWRSKVGEVERFTFMASSFTVRVLSF